MSSEIVKALRAWDMYDPNISDEKVLKQACAVIDAARHLPARLEALEAALEPFAGIAELVDLETEGLSDTDTFDLMFHDYLLDRFTLAHFRAARRAREGGNADG